MCGLAGPVFGEALAPGAARSGQVAGVLALSGGVAALARRTARRQPDQLAMSTNRL